MAKIKVHAGDFLVGSMNSFSQNSFTLLTRLHSMLGETIPASKLRTVEVASEESVKRLGGTVGWGVVGAVALGPLGLLAGLVAGGRGKDVTFVAEFNDGRRLLATTDSKTYTSILAAIFSRRSSVDLDASTMQKIEDATRKKPSSPQKTISDQSSTQIKLSEVPSFPGLPPITFEKD